jgi:alpha-L-rhamnosidase
MKRAYFSVLLFFVLIQFTNSAEWSSNWIWSSENGTANTWMCFRKTVDLTTVPTTAIANIGADSKYWLWINGKMVVFEGSPGRGPSPSNTWYEEINIQPYLKTGSNTIALMVWYFGRSQSGHVSSGKAGLVFQADLGGTILKSDNSWKIKLNAAYDAASGGGGGSVIPYSVKYNANVELGNWTSEGYNDASWTAATEKGIPPIAPWNKLEKNYVPNLKDHGLAYYVNYPESAFPFTSTGAAITCNVDFNKQLTPYLEVESTSGKTITIDAINLGTDNLKNSITTSYTTKDGVQSFEGLSWINGKSIKYIIPAGVVVKALKYRWTSIGEAPGTFECSNPFFQKLWSMAKNTLVVCARDNFMDCPDRERSLWIGDVADQCSGIFYSMDEPGRILMKKAILTTMAFRNNSTKVFGSGAPGWGSFELPAQSLQFVYDGIWNYYLNTGDLETIKQAYPAVHDYLSIYPMASTGFPEYRKGAWDWNDWGVDSNNGVVPDKEIIQICHYYMALKAAKKMALVIGNTTNIDWYNTRISGIEQKFNAAFWNGSYYCTGTYKEDRANAMAIVAGLADKSKYASIVTNVLVPVIKSSPHMEWVVEDAMCIAGYPVQAIERMKKRYEYQVEKTQNTTLNELFGTSGYLGTYNHAWNAPNTVLSRHIAGIAPDSAGWSIFHVMPMYAGISTIKTKVPTVKGDIQLDVAFNTNTESISLSSPKGTKAIVGIPKSRFTVRNITLNGSKIWNGTLIPNATGAKWVGEDEQFIKFSVDAGDWKFLADDIENPAGISD